MKHSPLARYAAYLAEILSPASWMRWLALRSRFTVIGVLVTVVLLFGFAEFALSMRIMSGMRAYVGGEGLWSKAEKGAVDSLVRYAASGDEADYRAFEAFLQVPWGDKQARFELEKLEPDYVAVRQGFIEGGNAPEDVDDMIFLYRRFRHVSYMDAAIRTWAEGDAGIRELRSVGDDMHAVVTGGSGAGKTTRLTSLVAQARSIDARLTDLEKRFSATLGEGSRRARDILLMLALAFTVLLGAITFAVLAFIRRIANEVDAAKSEFVALVSHQLRTPLTLMAWSLEHLAKTEMLEPAGKEDLQTARQETRRMAALINDILDVSRLETGVLAIQPYEIDIVAAARTVIAEIAPAAASKGVRVIERHPQAALLRVDPMLLHVIFTNLISNAVKYTPAGGIVSVGITRIAGDGVEISIADTGLGIPAAEQPKIFSKLFRGSSAMKVDSVGTGLGLYIVKAIIVETGGSIRFESEEGKGTTFFVSWPAAGMRPKTGDIRLDALAAEIGATIS